MKTTRYKNYNGDTATIKEISENCILLICRDKTGKIWKKQEYKKMRGVKTALGMAGPWIGFNHQH